MASLFHRTLSLPVLPSPLPAVLQRTTLLADPDDPVTDSCFRVAAPALLSISGGRTSGYMLHRILQAHGGQLPDGVHCAFFNTGMELPQTLDFLQAMSREWRAPITWLEFDIEHGADGVRRPIFRVVDRATASVAGEPFAKLIEWKGYLPNKVTRFCTAEMKVRTGKRWMMSQGHEYWTNVVGIRADEPKRLTGRADSKERWDRTHPLAEAGVCVEHVMRFWLQQPFDLQLRQDQGNCTLCFLKGKRKLVRLVAEHPELTSWWIAREAEIGAGALGGSAVARFNNRFAYTELLERAVGRGKLFEWLDDDEPEGEDCNCTD